MTKNLIELGIDRVLTSGQKETASEEIELLETLHKIAGDRIKIMPGSGVKL